jgi:hypothetical protein
VLTALVVAGAAFGIVTAVQADIPDGVVVQACYGKPGTPQRGQLRVRDADQGEQCRATENPIEWGQSGPTGPTGPTGPAGIAGPTSLMTGTTDSVPAGGVDLITHVVTPAEAGLTILTAPFEALDKDGSTGGSTAVDCSIVVNNIGNGLVAVLNDTGTAAARTTASGTVITRQVLAAGDVVKVNCFSPSDPDEAEANSSLLLERVGS